MQGKQYACPSFSCANPVGQFRHAADAYCATPCENLPGKHARHESLELDASFSLYNPATQLLQFASLVIPAASLHLPCGHGLQNTPFVSK
jgi:hypothetical protein